MTRLFLIASSDDYLLQESVDETIAELGEGLAGAEVVRLSEDLTPEQLAVELMSPSLFSPNRVLVMPEVRGWLGAAAPRGAAAAVTSADLGPLLAVLANGVPEGVGLVLASWCARQPQGELTDAVRSAGRVRWIALPAPPKPWEDVVLSKDQRTLLLGVLDRAVVDTRFTPQAQELLLERLGFAPRLLVQEATKLSVAATEGTVDEELVRQLTFPRERSLDVVRDAVLLRAPGPLVDLLAAAAGGLPMVDRQGQRLDPGRIPPAVFGQVATLLEQLLYLRRLAAEGGLQDELDPEKTSEKMWYKRRFTPRLVEPLQSRLADDGPSPLRRNGRKTTPWTLGNLFAAAGRYRDDELTAALAEAGGVEAALRGALALEAVSAWIGRLMTDHARP